MNLPGSLDLSQMEMVEGVKNFIESSTIRAGDRILLLADTRSDAASLQVVCTVLKVIGAEPMVMIMDHRARYDPVPEAALQAAKQSDCLVLVWPVFATRALESIRRPRTETSDLDPSAGVPGQPKLVYLECAPGMFATQYARFPNRLLWTIAKKVKAVVRRGHEIHVECPRGTNLTATYDPAKLFAIQTRPVEPGGRSHFPWGRCGVFHGAGLANGVAFLDAVQGIPGVLQPPMKWTVRENVLVDVEGGEAAQHVRSIMERYGQPVAFDEIMFGYHPKAPQWFGDRDYMHWSHNSKWVWIGNRTGPDTRPRMAVDGAIFHSSVWIDGDLILDNGQLTLLRDPEIRELAADYGDPYELLDSPISHGN